MNVTEVAGRMTGLEQAFRSLEHTVPGLQVDVIGHMSTNRKLVHPVAGFQVKLQHDSDSAGVLLYVSSSYAELTRWPATDGNEPTGAVRERFNVRLTDGLVWGETEFDSPEQLAHELLGYMQFNLDALTPI